MDTRPSTLVLALVAGAASLAAPAVAQVSPRKSAPIVLDSRKPAIGVPKRGVEPTTFYLTVLHNNDGESQLVNAGAGALADFGGVARFKTLADNLKAGALVYPPGPYERGSVMISSGDNFLAGPEFNASLSNGVPFYDTIAMELIGYDAAAIGNHEFDFGPDVLEAFVAGFVVAPPFLSANLGYAFEPGLQALEGAGRLARSTVVTVGTQQVGIIGATTPQLPFISSPRNTIVDPNVLAAVQAEVDALTLMGVNKIILTSHLQGLNEEFALAPMLRNVDIIIGGGGGELLANPTDLLVPGDSPWSTALGGTGYPRLATDLDGRTVPIVTTEGDYRYIGRLIVGFDALGNVTMVDPISGPVRVSAIAPDAVLPDPAVEALVTVPVQNAVAALAANVIGVSQVPLNGETSSVRSVETNLGNLAADAMLSVARQLAPTFGAPLPDVALQNGGGMRNNSILPAGDFTELNTFEVLPFANFVSVVPAVPAAQFKEIMENAVSRVGGSGNGRFAQIAGMRMVWDFSGTAQQLDAGGNVTVAGTRVRELILNDGRVIVRDGQVVPGAPAVNVATIDFLARGGDQYPYRGLPFVNLGVSYQQTMRTHIQSTLGGVISAQFYPEGGEGRITRLN